MGENWVHHLGSAVTFEGKERGVGRGVWGGWLEMLAWARMV